MLHTRNDIEKNPLTTPQKLPMQATFQTKPSHNVFKEGNWGHRKHPPLKSWQHQQLHSLNSLCLKHKPWLLHLTKKNQIPMHKKQNKRKSHMNKHLGFIISKAKAYLKVQEEWHMGLFCFRSKGQTSNSSELCHPRLVPLKLQTCDEPIEVVNSKNSGQSREPIVPRNFRNPVHSFNTRPFQGPIRKRTQMGLSLFRD